MDPPSFTTTSTSLLSMVFVSNKDRERGAGARCTVTCSKVTQAEECGGCRAQLNSQ